MVAPEPSTNPHHHSCRCNRCVARRNARRRMDEARYAGTDTPLPPMSQIYEIERDLPPVYVEDAVPRRALKGAPRVRRLEELLADQPSQYPRPIQPATTPKPPAKKPIKKFIAVMVALLVLASIGVFSWWQYAHATPSADFVDFMQQTNQLADAIMVWKDG